MSLRLCRESRSARALMGRVLRDGRDLGSEYPLVFGEQSAATIVVDEQDGAVRSTCAILPRTLIAGRERILIGMIGSVATDPHWRNRGLAGRVLSAAERELQARGAVLAILWADDARFYERRGWRFFGCEVDAVLKPGIMPNLPAAKGVRPMQPHDAAAVHELYLQHRARVDRSLEETRLLLACPGMEVLICEDGVDVLAYACLGRGGDMENVVHEWGGDPRAVGMILRRLIELRRTCGIEDDLYVMLPCATDGLLRLLFDAGATLAKGVLGMGKILDEAAARAALARALGTDQDVMLSGAELLDAWLPPRGDKAVRQRLAQQLGLTEASSAPAPFIWGLDSI
jgi:GNAT superfamily N-acetyltransferase